MSDYARDSVGDIIKKTYTIPFRPEYILIAPEPAKAGNSGELKPPAGPMPLVSLAAPTKRDIPSFRFHLAHDALVLIQKQDPHVKLTTGFCALTVEFDASLSSPAVIKATRGVLVEELAKK